MMDGRTGAGQGTRPVWLAGAVGQRRELAGEIGRPGGRRPRREVVNGKKRGRGASNKAPDAELNVLESPPSLVLLELRCR
jgi:hypothetical protein